MAVRVQVPEAAVPSVTVATNCYSCIGTFQMAREAKVITIKSLPSAPLVPHEG